VAAIAMKLTFKENVFSTTSAHRSLDEIINDIKFEKYKAQIEAIRNAESDADKKSLKNDLPVFMISARLDAGANAMSKSDHVSATGIVQFDIDEYDEAQSRLIIEQLKTRSSVLYAFLSPSSGVKFGVMTDFSCDDKAIISRKFKYAYEIVKHELADILEKIQNVDAAASSIALQCYVSSDKDVYYNKSCDALVINERVNELFRDEEAAQNERSKNITDRSSFDTTDEAVLRCLEYIPNDLPYDERLIINFSVIDHFKQSAKAVLLAHWSGVDDRKKLERDIVSQIKNCNGSISIATLFYIAKQYGYEYSSETDLQETEEKPTYYSDKYYTPAESTEHLRKIILKDFFHEKKDKAVIVECGSGKTRTMFKAVSDFLLENQNKNVAVFLKTHEMINQFIDDMNSNIAEYNKKIREEQGAFQQVLQSISWWHKPHKITGLEHHCQIYEAEVINKAGTSLCNDCFLRIEGICSYHEQFKQGNRVRIYTHNRLFQKPKHDQNFDADYIIIDEDIVSMMTNTKETLLSITESNYRSLRSILNDIKSGKTLDEAITDKHQYLQHDLRGIKSDILDIEARIKNLSAAIKKTQATGNYKRFAALFAQLELKEKYRDMFEELMHLCLGTKLQSKHIWLQYDIKNEAEPRLIYGKAKSILPEFKNTPMLYLDGSGEQVVIETLLERDFEFEHLRVQQQDNSKVYQFINDASFSKHSFLNEAGSKKIHQICDWIDTLETKKLGFIRYNRIYDDTNAFSEIDDKVTAMNRGEDRIGWFGNVRGINRFEDCDTLIVLGQHRLPNYEIFNLSQLIFREDVFGIEARIQVEAYNEYIEKLEITKVYRMKDGRHQAVKQTDYKTDFCRLTSDHFDKSETYQALHRLRLIHGTQKKQVFILSDTVLDVSLDALLDRYKELHADSIQCIKYLKSNKYIIDKNESFKDVFGWNNVKCNNFRRADHKGFGDWLKSHRSLKYWICETSDRRKVKLYSWHDQSEENVRSWLSEQDIKVKSLTFQ